MEYGVGIHGEPGIRREPIAQAGDFRIVCRSLDAVVGLTGLGRRRNVGHGRCGHRAADLKRRRGAGELAARMVDSLCQELGESKRVAVLVNGFGATPLMELYLFKLGMAAAGTGPLTLNAGASLGALSSSSSSSSSFSRDREAPAMSMLVYGLCPQDRRSRRRGRQDSG